MNVFEEKPKRGEINGIPSETIAKVVIVVGVILLVANLGIFSSILSLWPLALVGVGVWYWKGKGTNMEIKHEHYSAGLENATSARVKISLPVGETTIREIDDAETLIDADMNFVGDMVFKVKGDDEKTVSLKQTGDSWQNWMNPSNWNFDSKRMRSTIGLNTSVPMTLDVSGGVGQSTLDLSRLHINDLDVNGGVGEIVLTLPTQADTMDVRAQVGVGRLELNVPAAINLNAHVKGGIGEAQIRLPSGVAVRLVANSGIGDINVGGRLQKVKGNNGGFGLGKSGVWETADFGSASTKIVIHYDGGIGQLSIR